MVSRRLIVSSAVVGVVLAVGGWLAIYDRPMARQTMTIGGRQLMVDLAITPADQQRGLMGRTSLSEDEGMLFIFPQAAEQTFWMKGMLIPIDIIWIYGGKVTGVTADNKPAEQLSRVLYPSPGPVSAVLEVAAGWAERHGIIVGTAVSY